MKGILLNLEEYCDYCPDFEPVVNKVEITNMDDKTPRVQSSIRCEFSDRCAAIYNKAREDVKNEKSAQGKN